MVTVVKRTFESCTYETDVEIVFVGLHVKEVSFLWNVFHVHGSSNLVITAY